MEIERRQKTRTGEGKMTSILNKDFEKEVQRKGQTLMMERPLCI